MNSTLHLVSSYNISWFVERSRQHGTATISHFFRPDDPDMILNVTGALIYAYNDAKARCELDEKPWSDPFKRNVPVQTTDEGHSDDETGHGGTGRDDVNGPGGTRQHEDDTRRSRKRRRGGEGRGRAEKKKKTSHPSMDLLIVRATFHLQFPIFCHETKLLVELVRSSCCIPGYDSIFQWFQLLPPNYGCKGSACSPFVTRLDCRSRPVSRYHPRRYS
jgi:hypothetical protein